MKLHKQFQLSTNWPSSCLGIWYTREQVPTSGRAMVAKGVLDASNNLIFLLSIVMRHRESLERPHNTVTYLLFFRPWLAIPSSIFSGYDTSSYAMLIRILPYTA